MSKRISKANLAKRVDEARALARFAKIHRDTGRVFEVFLPGHDAKQYRVILKWLKTGKDHIMQSECGLNCGNRGYTDCKGNSFNVCYHTFAAVVAVAEAHGAEVAFAATETDAMRLVNMKKRANRLFSKQSMENVWIVS